MKKILPLILCLLVVGMTGCAKKVDSSTLDKTIENKYAFAAADNSTGEVTEPTPEPTIEPSLEPTATPEPTPTPTATPKPTPETTKTPDPTPIKNKDTVYDISGVDANKVIKGSSKFAVSVNNMNPKVGQSVKVDIKAEGSVNANARFAVACDDKAKYGGENFNSSDKINYSGNIIIQSTTSQNNTIDLYIFITDNSDSKVYEYKFNLNIQK